jgi:Mn2+/Fe2+ NRAMP family transporter
MTDPTPSAPLPAQDASLLSKLGPGLITGAADDDPSGIATYSQAGAQFGFNTLWTLLFTFPLMVAIQVISAKIGRVTGHGLATNIRRHFPAPLLYMLVGLLLVLQVLVPYQRYVKVLKWLTLALLAYVATVFAVDVPWLAVARGAVMPAWSWKPAYITTIVAVFGTTISPYLFFWQASQEVEDLHADKHASALRRAPDQVVSNFRRIKLDTVIGMAFSNLVAFFIMLTTAVTLHRHGVTEIATSAEAASALRPIAGDFAFFLFSMGIIGTGLLAVPVLAGSAAYAMAGTFRWANSLELKPMAAKRFYGIIAVATLLGVALCFTPIDPIKALYWSAVINGVISVPIMVVMMLLASRTRVMGRLTISVRLRVLGWGCTAAMAAAVGAMFATTGS